MEENLKQLSSDLSGVNVKELYDKIQQTQDDPAAIAISLGTTHHDYVTLATRIKLRDIYARSHSTFTESMHYFSDQLNEDFLKDVDECNSVNEGKITLLHNNDKLFDYVALQVLENLYLLKEGNYVERPQYMFMRLAIHLHGKDLAKVRETYEYLSRQTYIHSSPTMMNAGRKQNQLSSCFLMASPSMDTFFQSLEKCHKILKCEGGIGYYFHRIPARHLVHCAKILNGLAKVTDSKRSSTCTVYIEPWHAGIYDFLSLKRNIGSDEARARDLFYALWIPDLFMHRVHTDGMWSLFCPEAISSATVQLHKLWGSDFEKAYLQLEATSGIRQERVKARDLFREIAVTQIETGGPFILFKDTCNRQSPYSQTIEGSNLCTEIIQHAGDDAGTAVCNLASVSLPSCCIGSYKLGFAFDYELLKNITRVAVSNLDRTIDKTWYPTECSRKNNLLYRPIGLGVQGLADVFQMMKIEYGSSESRQLNKTIFRVMREAAEKESRGTNKLLLAVMPTATTSLVLGNCENVEPYTNNIFVRRSSTGNFVMLNRHLVQDLRRLHIYDKEYLINHRGSVQEMSEEEFPFRSVYKTVWEIPPETLLEMAADRNEYIDQSQSLNIYMKDPNVESLNSLIQYAFSLGLKTGMYYLRTQPATHPIPYSCLNSVCCD